MSAISNAVATIDEGQAMIEQYQDHFAQVLPSHIPPKTFVRLAQGILRKNAGLRDAAQKNPGSFLAALLECARLGHEPGTDQYALAVFGGEVVGIEQYQGEIERMYRAGGVTAVKCEVVRQNDHFKWAPTRMQFPEHEYDALADDDARGPLAGAYAYAHMINGAISQVVVMGKGEVMKHKAVAKTTKFWNGPWEPSMWKKTAVHELEKWVVTSSEFRKEQLRAAMQVSQETSATLANLPPINVDTTTGEITDAELVDEPETHAQADKAMALDEAS